jgi:hypothetical protein
MAKAKRADADWEKKSEYSKYKYRLGGMFVEHGFGKKKPKGKLV